MIHRAWSRKQKQLPDSRPFTAHDLAAEENRMETGAEELENKMSDTTVEGQATSPNRFTRVQDL